MSSPVRIILPDGSYIERSVHPFTNSRSKNKGKIKYKREWWRVHRKGVNQPWELKDPLGGEFRVYVLELKKQVWEREKKFRDRNPEYQTGKPLVYVGHTSKTIDERVAAHRSGTRSSPYVRKYFKRKRPSAYKDLPVFRSRSKALDLEAKTAAVLRSRGWGVWEGKVEDLQLHEARSP